MHTATSSLNKVYLGTMANESPVQLPGKASWRQVHFTCSGLAAAGSPAALAAGASDATASRGAADVLLGRRVALAAVWGCACSDARPSHPVNAESCRHELRELLE